MSEETLAAVHETVGFIALDQSALSDKDVFAQCLSVRYIPVGRMAGPPSEVDIIFKFCKLFDLPTAVIFDVENDHQQFSK